MEQLQQQAEQIELACVGLQSLKEQERATSERIIASFNQMRSPYVLCFHILERSSVVLAHFYTLSTIRDAAVREWSSIASNDRSRIVEYLLGYLVSDKAAAVSTTRRQACNALAVIIKRAWLDPEKFTEQNLSLSQLVMTRIYSMMSQLDNENVLMAGIGLAASLVTEMSGSSKSSPIHLTWDYHQRTLVSFQNEHLQPIVRHILSLLTKMSFVVSARTIPLLHVSIQLLVETLEWQFTEASATHMTYLSAMPKNIQSSFFRPLESWRQLIHSTEKTNESVNIVDLVFGLYSSLSGHKEISHLLRVAMTRLACLSGPTINQATVRNEYLVRLLNHISPLLSNAIQQHSSWVEMEDLSNLLHRICSNFKFQALASIPLNYSSIFIENISKFILSSLNIMKIAVEKGDGEMENEFENECFLLLLKGWVSLLTDIESLIGQKKANLLEHFEPLYHTLKSCNDQIYINYVKTRIQLSHIDLESFDADDDLDQDINKYNDQLKMVSFVGRMSAASSLEILKNEINGCVDRLIQQGGNIQPKEYAYVAETLHWLILLAGHLLFDSENTSITGIPTPIEQYSYQFSLQNNNNNNVNDPIVELCNSILRYAFDYELKSIAHFKSCERLSPLVTESSMWFLAGWSLVYLLPSSSMNPHLSPRLEAAYSKPESVAVIVKHLVEKISLNLEYWSSEPAILRETSSLLGNISINTELVPYLFSSWNLLFPLKNDLLVPTIQCKLYQSFTNIVYSTKTTAELGQFFNQLAIPIMERLDALLSRADLKMISNDVQIKESFYIILERIKGIISVSPQRFSVDGNFCVIHQGSDLFLKYSASLVNTLIPLYSHNQDTIVLILYLFSRFTKNQFEDLDDKRSGLIYQVLVQLFKSEHLFNNVQAQNKDFYDRMKIVIKILHNLVNSDVESELLIQTIYTGVCSVMPSITNRGLLDYPKLSNRFFDIIKYIFSSDDIDLTKIPSEVALPLFSLVEVGISHHDTDIAKMCLESIASMTKNLNRASSAGLDLKTPFTKLIGSILNFLLLQDFNMDDLLYSASTTLSELVISCPDGYKAKVIELIQQQDPSIQPLILGHYEQYISNPPAHTKLNFAATEQFTKNLKEFITRVKPLLQKK
ncbi:exportin 4 [Cavenderia fasciculata]|uniref:Exportin-4 n=1 Tax=Cavenderia fasciculata TaxID=261658 RepID=F4PHQ0_CACFS|nr:exportin 4 [Cavenderia fasciculata]EGG25234.1 exportin 4 [Cavenderia fasciculata]|eukprot:XP_004363085.1 exportin 4 [Cavenderia fasciculata]